MEQNPSIRLKFFEVLNSQHRDLVLLNAMLKEAYITRPDIFDAHVENKAYEQINSDQIDWDGPYFFSHIRSLQHNFSFERATHLIEVCRLLTEQGHAGFSITTAMLNDSGNHTMNNKNTTVFIASQSLKAALNSGSVNRLRSALVAELENNRQDKQAIYGAVAWAEEHVSDLFEPYEEHSLAQGFEQDSSKWDTDYYGLQSTYLSMNFARDRFDHLMVVYQVLRDRAVAGFVLQPKQQPQNQSRGQTSSSTLDRHSPSPESMPHRNRPSVLKVAMLAGGAIAVLAALIITLMNHPHILPIR